MNRWHLWKRIIPLLMVFSLLLTGCSLVGQGSNPIDPKASVAEEQYGLILLSLGIMILVVIVVFVLYFYAIVRYRRKPGDDSIPKQVEGSHKLEIIWTVIPLILLLILAIPSVAITFSQDEDYTEDPEVIQVKAIGHQFWWEFEYSDLEIYTAQDLVLPVNQRVQFELTATDVKHSFWIPGMGGKMDTNPGNINLLYLDTPAEPEVLLGKCAEFCGASHALMDFKVRVVSEEEYDAWVANMQAPTAAVDADVQSGEELFKQNCMSCHAIESGFPGLGPNLKGFADRELVGSYLEMTDENIFKWIKNPQEVKGGSTMPAIPLEDDQFHDIVKYLKTLTLE
ncbi:cytochrome c oxidase subunit II [Chengkuizengella marina]|uniref:Cytochrome c oxidase subunit 2 n=1 Tax=Chengkuizengella marina TaxID=2507566 RepID=A0A6N9Q5F8_9BACL|nr:cytochrome c oxidase subunit II [Chengkuizengella marina]NBI30052.1 cytochrome c oxidase subunit II [Chengkuizengella marina]